MITISFLDEILGLLTKFIFILLIQTATVIKINFTV